MLSEQTRQEPPSGPAQAGSTRDPLGIRPGTGRHPALQCAEHAVVSGAETFFVSIDGEMAAELTYAERAIWKQRIYELEVEMTFDHRLERIEKSGNRLTATFVN